MNEAPFPPGAIHSVNKTTNNYVTMPRHIRKPSKYYDKIWYTVTGIGPIKTTCLLDDYHHYLNTSRVVDNLNI